MSQGLSPSAQKVQDTLEALGFPHKVVELPPTMRTAAAAAQAIGGPVAQIAKSRIFIGQTTGKFILALSAVARSRYEAGRNKAMKTFFIALRTAACTIIAVLLFGWVILRARTLDPKFGVFLPAWTGTPGLILTVAGGILVLWCFGIFVVLGRGTPSPLDPPREFVAVGPYRYVRNPIHIGQVILFTGLGLYLRSVSILLFALAWLLFCHLYVVYVEEPSLKRKFGATYEKYFRAVHRWIPNIVHIRKEQGRPIP